MVLIFGQTMCGRVDQVPGACYVATRFFHLYYIPLIPLSSWVIVQGSENSSGFKGQQIPMSLKSVMFGWLQAYLIVFGLISSVRGAIQIAELQQKGMNPFNGELTLVLGVLCLIVWVLFKFRPLRAQTDRANEMLTRLGLQPAAGNEEPNWG